VKLERFKYREREASGEEWEIEPLNFGRFNLVVGRNATGKTRLLKAIARVAGELSGESRTTRNMRFELETDSRDEEAKVEWSRLVQYLPFSAEMNFRSFKAGTVSHETVAEAFLRGTKIFGKSFEEEVRTRVNEVGYEAEEIGVAQAGTAPARLELRQAGRSVTTSLRKLSQAQQRTLTLLTYVTLLERSKTPATLLIDDFGEGLDFESAGRLATLVLRISEAVPLQFIIATNDRYVMNVVPLEYWTVLVDDAKRTRVFNYSNSKQKFDDFKFTGLSNFDFFSMDFARQEA
jgi:energy-coupling factor transporter ATP-binding protein EcfA2